MKLNFTGSTDPGLIRSNNQDAYYIDPTGRFFIVADGMGGHAGGEEASRIATQKIRAFLEEYWEKPQSNQEILEQAFFAANSAILLDQQNHAERSDMGTTVVAVLWRSPETPVCAHVGDSRLYCLRQGILKQITQDHTWIARAIEIGDISPDEARVHPFRHVLSRCLGREDLNHIDVQPLDLQESDLLLLCSDGLTEELIEQQITACLQTSPELDQVASSLITAAKDQGGHDNITVVLIAVEQDS
ncbi:Stp1/IreP family PP2C-type Ser/Thr phosphatase [Cronbergia sp. UHCC 0137]|uniref:Stp1/IreP family PP2C-type Ser/Thr phosphatase n=1 Tax=Cronbergia sp. UHCC 0137 TaxID=3110239 RepID=UPI002B205970|nr:Stp1/IreP family PP2C-type Ser/Thr phosphatase [Cronbergia sp. UHCC 0137]MEA5616235.1 Stp1/IreP family PP2C-type Ser/Thr phosphatase [Cronbergia sp. UHCC 0137]